MNRRSSSGKAKAGDDDQPPPSPTAAAIIEDPLETDLILGRGSAHAWRPANVAFHRLLDSYAPRYYSNESTKKTKTAFIHEIYHQMAQRGRFLTKHGTISSESSPDVFVELSEHDAKARISDAMRYRQRRRKHNRSNTRVATAAVAARAAAAATASLAQDEQGPSDGSQEQMESATESVPQRQQQRVDNQPSDGVAAALQNPGAANQPQQNTAQVEIFSDNDLSSVLDHVDGFPGGNGGNR